VDGWLGIGIDLGVLAFFGFLYYIWQRKRIISVSREYIFNDLHEFNFDVNKYAEANKSSPTYQLLNKFTNNLDSALKEENLEQVLNLKSSINDCLTQEQNQDFTAICNQIVDFNNSK